MKKKEGRRKREGNRQKRERTKREGNKERHTRKKESKRVKKINEQKGKKTFLAPCKKLLASQNFLATPKNFKHPRKAFSSTKFIIP